MKNVCVFSDNVHVIGYSDTEPYNWAGDLADRKRFRKRIKYTGDILRPVLLKHIAATNYELKRCDTTDTDAVVLGGQRIC